MAASVHVESVLKSIDEASRDWPQRFQTADDELLHAIGHLFRQCTPALVQLSASTDDSEQTTQDRHNAERITSKLKELRLSLDHLWPANIDSFARDVFDVESCQVVAAEFFQPMPFYPGNDFMMKLYRWSVYDEDDTVICRYHLEKSELMPGQPYHVLGVSHAAGHAQIQPYGSTIPDYNRMKIDVIKHLNGQGSSPVIATLRQPVTES